MSKHSKQQSQHAVVDGKKQKPSKKNKKFSNAPITEPPSAPPLAETLREETQSEMQAEQTLQTQATNSPVEVLALPLESEHNGQVPALAAKPPAVRPNLLPATTPQSEQFVAELDAETAPFEDEAPQAEPYPPIPMGEANKSQMEASQAEPKVSGETANEMTDEQTQDALDDVKDEDVAAQALANPEIMSSEQVQDPAPAAPLAVPDETEKSAPPKPPKPVKPPKALRPPKIKKIQSPDSKAGALFNALSCMGLPVLLLLAALFTSLQLYQVRDLWFSDEVRHAAVYTNMLSSGEYWALGLNGMPYPDKPPLYFWFLEYLDQIPSIDPPMLFFLGVALCSVLMVGLTWIMSRATGHSRKEAFAAGLILLTSLFFIGLAHYPRMDMLFALGINLSLLCLYRGWIKSCAPIWLTLGFVLVGLATLVKGPLALAFTLVPSILFLFVRGTPGRLNSRDGIPGFALMLLMLLGWVVVLYLGGHGAYIQSALSTHVAGRIVDAWHHAQAWWYYLALMPLLCLPWVFLPLVAHWIDGLKKIPQAWRERREKGGRLWMWCVLICGMTVLSLISGKTVVYILPLAPAMAILAAPILLNLKPGRSRCLFAMIGLVYFVLGSALLLLDFADTLFPLFQSWIAPLLQGILPESWPKELPPLALAYIQAAKGLALMGGVLIALGLALWLMVNKLNPAGSLLAVTLGMLIMVQPYAWYVAPSLGTVLSTKAPSLALAEFAQQGYTPAAYRVYSGVFAYYAQSNIPDIDTQEELQKFLTEHEKAAVIMSRKNWEKLVPAASFAYTNHPPQGSWWMVDREMVILLRENQGMIIKEKE